MNNFKSPLIKLVSTQQVFITVCELKIRPLIKKMLRVLLFLSIAFANAFPLSEMVINNRSYTLLSTIYRRPVFCSTLHGGCNSVVYNAISSSGKPVVIKMKRKKDWGSERSHFEILKDQPRIVKLLDFAENPYYQCFVLENGGKDLEFWRKYNLGTLNIPNTWIEMLLGVKQMHEKNVAHLDLKPQNFIFSYDKLKIIDFDISAELHANKDHVTYRGRLGTEGYQSPEALGYNWNSNGRRQLGKEADIWALGAILYELIYGKDFKVDGLPPANRPLDDPQYQAYIREPESHVATPEVEALKEIMRACIRLNPNERPTIDKLMTMTFKALIPLKLEKKREYETKGAIHKAFKATAKAFLKHTSTISDKAMSGYKIKVSALARYYQEFKGFMRNLSSHERAGYESLFGHIKEWMELFKTSLEIRLSDPMFELANLLIDYALKYLLTQVELK